MPLLATSPQWVAGFWLSKLSKSCWRLYLLIYSNGKIILGESIRNTFFLEATKYSKHHSATWTFDILHLCQEPKLNKNPENCRRDLNRTHTMHIYIYYIYIYYVYIYIYHQSGHRPLTRHHPFRLRPITCPSKRRGAGGSSSGYGAHGHHFNVSKVWLYGYDMEIRHNRMLLFFFLMDIIWYLSHDDMIWTICWIYTYIYMLHIGCNHHHIKISICLMVWASSIHFHQKNKSPSDCDENQHQLKHSVLMCACHEETTTQTSIIYIYTYYLYLNEFVDGT